MKNVLIPIIFAIIVLGGGFYLVSNRSAQIEPFPKYTGPIEKITVGEIEAYSILNLVAKEKGIFRENGLDVQIKEYESGPPEFTDLLAGKIDIATAAEFVGVRYMFTSPELKILSEIATNDVFQVIGRKSHGIKIPADLKNKKIGITRKSAGEFYLGRFLSFNGLSLGDVTIIDMLPIDMVNHLEKNDGVIDAAVFSPRSFNLEEKLGSDNITWSAQGDQKTFGLILSTDRYIKASPGVIERYVRSLAIAQQYYKEHPKETKDLVANILHYDDSYIQYIWSRFNYSVRLEQSLLLVMEDEASWTIENKLTDSTTVPNYLNYFYFDALANVKPEAITIIR